MGMKTKQIPFLCFLELHALFHYRNQPDRLLYHRGKKEDTECTVNFSQDKWYRCEINKHMSPREVQHI